MSNASLSRINDLIRVCAVPGCNQTANGRHCPAHRVKLPSVYNRRWRTVIRPAVLARDGYRCRYCGQPGTRDRPLDAAHLDQTQQLLREGGDVYNLERIVSAHKACHNANAPHLLGGVVKMSGRDERTLPHFLFLSPSGNGLSSGFAGCRPSGQLRWGRGCIFLGDVCVNY